MTADPKASGARPRREPQSPPSTRRTPGRRSVALIALVLGLAGFAISATEMATQLLPRQFTAAQQQQIVDWEIASRWQQLTAGKIFPASIRYQLSATVLQDTTPLNLAALRIGVAPQSGCGTGVTTSAAAEVLSRDGCQAVLRATYVDATRSYIMTVGVAVLPSDAAATRASQSLSRPRPETGTLAAGILVVRYRGSAAALYDYSRQISASFADGPYLVMYAAGYADSRPRVPVASDHYSYAEMTSMAKGVVKSVEDTLAARPPSPHCPGAPGC